MGAEKIVMARIEAYVDPNTGNLIFAAHTGSGSQAFAVTQQCDPRLFEKIARDFNELIASVADGATQQEKVATQ